MKQWHLWAALLVGGAALPAPGQALSAQALEGTWQLASTRVSLTFDGGLPPRVHNEAATKTTGYLVFSKAGTLVNFPVLLGAADPRMMRPVPYQVRQQGRAFVLTTTLGKDPNCRTVTTKDGVVYSALKWPIVARTANSVSFLVQRVTGTTTDTVAISSLGAHPQVVDLEAFTQQRNVYKYTETTVCTYKRVAAIPDTIVYSTVHYLLNTPKSLQVRP